MEPYQVLRLINSSDGNVIGGGFKEMKIVAALGILDTILVEPADREYMEDELWDSQFVKLQLGDRIIWFEPDELEQLIEFMHTALRAAWRNYHQVF